MCLTFNQLRWNSLTFQISQKSNYAINLDRGTIASHVPFMEVSDYILNVESTIGLSMTLLPCF